jgi:hypothetical protein
MLTKTKDLLSPATPVKPEATRNDWANRLAELFDKAQDAHNEAYWLLVVADELHDGLKDIASAVADSKELAAALDSAAWALNAAENIQDEFEILSDMLRCLEVSEVKADKIKT